MKKNIIVSLSILIILAVVVLVIISLSKAPEVKKQQTVKQSTSTDVIADIKNDLGSVDFGNLEDEFRNVNKDIQTL